MSDENQNPEDEPKIIVDEDWKSQVEREKEELKQQQEKQPETEGEPSIPPASFQMLISTLATQAMVALGILPDPVSGEPSPNLPLAKHFIDNIAILEEKTKGNLDESEANQIEEALHQLRMIYVTSKNEGGQDDAKPKSTIELP